MLTSHGHLSEVCNSIHPSVHIVPRAYNPKRHHFPGKIPSWLSGTLLGSMLIYRAGILLAHLGVWDQQHPLSQSRCFFARRRRGHGVKGEGWVELAEKDYRCCLPLMVGVIFFSKTLDLRYLWVWLKIKELGLRSF